MLLLLHYTSKNQYIIRPTHNNYYYVPKSFNVWFPVNRMFKTVVENTGVFFVGDTSVEYLFIFFLISSN